MLWQKTQPTQTDRECCGVRADGKATDVDICAEKSIERSGTATVVPGGRER